MRKLSKRQVIFRKLSKKDEKSVESFIKEMKETVKKDPEMIAKFKEYGVPISEIDYIFVEFAPLDVSAKTKDMKVYLNEEMLSEKSKVKDPTHYLIHEFVHFLQQKTGKNLSKHNTEDSYLDKPTELEAFKSQVDFKERTESPQSAEKYVENLLDHHEIDGKDRKEKKEELLEE